jgi:hypothetical protein
MSKETGPKRMKRLVLSILQNYAGDPEGLDLEIFYQSAGKMTGLHRLTLEKMLKEQIGQVNIEDGRIKVVADALLISTTHRVRPDTDDGDGRGISNGVKKWNWRT